ncbi:MAG: Holliday junction resolvase RuvX [Planctomycetes bacterium]|nr:Holliday junction resolvase RuvX [Planctomycetota bacterium]
MRGRGRLLGIDYGTVRVGLAISDPDRIIASPLTTYTRQGAEVDAEFLRKLIADERVESLVLGLPVHTNGREGIKAAESRQFGVWLKEVTGLPLIFVDERFTTADAENALWNAGLSHRKRKERRDRVAAQIFLQAYLDAKCPEETEILGLDE